MNESDHRRHPRLKHRAKIRVTLPVRSQEFMANLRDFSESGLFLICSDVVGIELGAIVEVQTTELEDAPVQKTRVVRIEAGVGFAVEFMPA